MIYLCNGRNNLVESINISILFILGLSILGGLLGASFFQKLHIPQVVGFIVIGLIVGDNGLKLVKHSDVTILQPFTIFALGIIGFLVGGELKAETFRKYARQFFAILLGEGLIAFLIVGLSIGLFIYFAFHNVTVAFAAGIVFGAVASATDPASTIDVLWEYRCLGILTTSLTAIVALDDALAMILYGMATGLVKMVAGVSTSFFKEIGKVFIELLGAAILAFIGAAILRYLLLKVKLLQKNFAFAIGLLLLLISIAVTANMDVILTSMAMGCILVNMLPNRSTILFEYVRSFSTPIYVLFFVLAGARLSITEMPGWLWAIVFIYVIGRSIGKIVGSYIGARITGSEPVVRRYLGLGLFAQGGVAIGLSIMASHYLTGIQINENLMLGDVIIFGIAATTLIVQLFGPPMVKLALKLSGEAGRNVTRDDVIESWTVADVMDTEVVSLRENDLIAKAAQTFVRHDYLVYPVLDKKDQIIGILSLEALKDVLSNPDAWHWLLVSDVMRPIEQKVFSRSPLKEVLNRMNELNIDQIPVLKYGNGDVPIGLLDRAKVNERIDIEVFRRRQAIEIRRSQNKTEKKEIPELSKEEKNPKK
jgi:Kef-type K+ transport system membrane component KefB/predicted transcriptional regulator